MGRILIVDDENSLRGVLRLLLTEHGHSIADVASGEDALGAAMKESFDVVLLDLSLPGMTGLQVLQKLHDHDPDSAVILMTAFGTIRSAVDAMRAGAFDYLTKPFDNDELLVTVDRALALRRLNVEVASLRKELESRYGFNEIVGISSAIREVFRVMARVAGNDVTVLVQGESGTGKELVARGIHTRGSRAKGPFVPVNCSAIPSTLIEAEFFGFERGAFTDAKESRAGKFEQAHQGTLFLDEVGDLPIEAQAKLLRVIQDRNVVRLGSQRVTSVDVRIIAATNRNLEAEVAKGQFREDLFWRLNVVSLRLPPLRERAEDLSLLIDHLLGRINSELRLNVSAMSTNARRLLLAYDWPGNVRELENTLRQAVVLAEGSTLRARDLPVRVRGGSPTSQSDDQADFDDGPTLADAVARAVERIERSAIMATLADTKGNRTAAALVLGIHRKTLFNKMRLYGLTTDQVDVDP